jgi:4-hydroxy 2-oxovalerate aldolase
MAKILDCTFRDGGYQTNWNFSIPFVEDYLNLIHRLGVEIAEIGFRAAVTLENQDSGPFFFSNEKFLKSLSLPDTLQIAVMINSDEISEVKTEVNSLFPPAAESIVSLVRIASRINDIKKSYEIAVQLQDKGYKVALNLMESTPELISSEKFLQISQLLGTFDYVFLADSFGILSPAEINEMDSIFKETRSEYGLHLHDNRGLAYANALAGEQNGVLWLDSTAAGLGRGAGNLRTEQLLIDSRGKETLLSSEFSQLLDLIQTLSVGSLEQWPMVLNPLYFLGARFNVHPNVVLKLIRDASPELAIKHIIGQGTSN